MSDQNAAAQQQQPIAPATETAAPAAPQKDERMEQLAQKERAIRHQARQLQADRAKLEADRKTLQSAPKDDSWKQRLKTDFAGVIAEAGLTQEELAERVMGTGSNDLLMRQMQAELKELKAKLGETEEGIVNTQKKAYEQALNQVRRDITSIVDSDAEYETIKLMGQQEAVLALIEETFNKDGYVMPTADACKQVEDYLLDEAMNLTKSKKMQQKLQAPTEQAKEAPVKNEPQKPANAPQARTLTNAITQSSTGSNSDRERKARAIAAFLGQTKT